MLLVNHIAILIEIIVFKLLRAKRKSIIYTLMLFQLGIPLAFRGITVGVDTPTYYNAITHIMANPTLNYGFEIGNLVIIRLVALFSNNPTAVVALYGFLTVFLYIYYFAKMSSDVYLSIFAFESLLFYNFSFNGMRQGLAMGFACCAVALVYNDKKVFSLLLIIIGSTIHLTCILFIIIWLFSVFGISFSPKKALVSLPIVLILLINTNKLITMGVGIFSSYESYLSYFGMNGTLLNPIIFAFMFIFCFVISYSKPDYSNDSSILMWQAMIGVVVYFMSINFLRFNRVALYFNGAFLVLVPNSIAKLTNRKTASFIRVLFYGLFFIYYCLLLYKNSNLVNPYIFIWQ